ncbi:MAG: ABC transporter substrate-binding protein [Gordonia sp. (in: high G+C Gram-positive bacteria)]|uniref:ABC transporter substrate-binding protein n=1 Tax=Gordonia sp. (in: high G+C Gram-positive bacteria) TaxID=84139 RepID=UPI0039E325F2
MVRGRDRFPGRRALGTRLAAAAVATSALVPVLSACGSASQAKVINVYPPADGASFIEQRGDVCSKESGGRYTIKVTSLPKSADDQRLQLARRLAGNDHGLDVMGMDVVWTAEFANAGWIRPVPSDMAAEAEADQLPGPLETAMWKRPDDQEKRLYAVPTWTNTELLWYRPDQLKKYSGAKAQAPETWDQMLSDSGDAVKANGPAQILVQGKQYEGLMVWFNSVLASAGGSILDPNDASKQTLNDTSEHRAATYKALQILKSVATAPGHDPSITNSDEGSARLGMEKGEAAFEINWPFVFASARSNGATGDVDFLKAPLAQYASRLTDEDNPPTNKELGPINKVVRQYFDFAPYPGVYPDKPAKSTLGGINLAVASTSQHPDLAWDAVKCLTSEDSQKVYAVDGGTPPTLESVYDDPDFKDAYPMGDVIREQMEADHAAPRPASPQYQAISTLVTATLSPVGSWDPKSMVDELAKQVQRAIDGEGIIP